MKWSIRLPIVLQKNVYTYKHINNRRIIFVKLFDRVLNMFLAAFFVYFLTEILIQLAETILFWLTQSSTSVAVVSRMRSSCFVSRDWVFLIPSRARWLEF